MTTDHSSFLILRRIASIHLMKGTLSGLRKLSATENLLKLIKNYFCFTLKALFVLKIFKFLSGLFGHVEKTARLERLRNLWHHNMVNKQLQYTYISRTKRNQTMKFDQNITWKTFLFLKSYTKCGEETISGPFSEKIKIEYISGSIV